jgi:hypothetical protein
MTEAHADLAASVQARLEEVMLDLARWTYDAAGGPDTLTMAGGTALNCVANARIAAEGPFRRVWVQPAAGDSGTALGAALHVSRRPGRWPFAGADLGRGWSDDELEAELQRAALPYTRPRRSPPRPRGCSPATASWPGTRAAASTARARWAPVAAGASRRPRHHGRMNNVKGREQFRPIAPMVRAERFADIFDGVFPSPYMLFVHQVRPEWTDRIPAVVHVDGTARVQTVHAETEPLVAEMLAEFERLTGLPVVVNTSLNTAGRPMVDTRARPWSCSVPRRWTCWRWDRSRSTGQRRSRPAGRRSVTAGVTVVVPTLGRPSLTVLLTRWRPGSAPLPVEVLVVDDRADRREPLAAPGARCSPAGPRDRPPPATPAGGRAPEWVAFLDDDVVPDPDWLVRLAADLAAAGRRGRRQGRLRVPLPAGRRPTDWERVTAGLADGEWITADMAYRTAALERAGGFDERLPRAFREDAELAHRVRAAAGGWCAATDRDASGPAGEPVGSVSARSAATPTNALLRRLYGPRWREVLGVRPAGGTGTPPSPRPPPRH